MFEAVIASPLQGGSPAITPLGHFGRAIVQCREADIAIASRALGVELSRKPCRFTQERELSALWLGPEEWLILNGSATDDCVQSLVARLNGVKCSIVDVSHRQVGLSVQGPRAEDILASGCALDLTLGAFPVGMSTRTMFAKAEIVLWRIDAEKFHIEVWRSFAQYVEALLRETESEV